MIQFSGAFETLLRGALYMFVTYWRILSGLLLVITLQSNKLFWAIQLDKITMLDSFIAAYQR